MIQKHGVITLISIGLAGMIFLSSCCFTPDMPLIMKNGVVCGGTEGLFRHRWWNYYERGVSFAECGMYEEAKLDFREAIRQRDRDQERARTYGMHFIDYFTHRELGIVHYYTGEMADAVKELEISLHRDKAETERAELFLHLAREKLIRESEPDGEPPRNGIDDPSILKKITSAESWKRGASIQHVHSYEIGEKA